MDCTNYNEAINYNAPIPYNGVCVSPVTTVVAGGHYNYVKPRRKDDDDLAMALMALELLDDD
jgi:hypothetical protein